MRYRNFGRMGREVSALGFGAMRLPTSGDEKDIDEPAAIEMLRYAIDHGVNYVDTAYGYHGGNSELVVAKALRDGYREKVALATKSPIWKVENREDFDRFLNEQLQKLETEHLDFYLLHCLQKKSWPKMQDLGVLAWAEGAMADGRIGRFGFSFHDGFEAFKEVLDAYQWPFCQIQYNYMSEEVQAGTKGLEYAAEKGVGVIIMEPLFGGTLANPPGPIQEIWDAAEKECSPVDMALQWLWNKPEVSLVLSGMSSLDQVKQNIDSACCSGVGSLDAEDLDLVARVREKYREFFPVPCTNCRYCLPCPNEVDIPTNFQLYNAAVVFKGTSLTLCRNLYRSLPEAQRAQACAKCGTCQQKCPQQIEISELMCRVHQELG